SDIETRTSDSYQELDQRSQRDPFFSRFRQLILMKHILEITSEDGDVVSDLLLAHKLEHVPAVVGGRLTLPLQEFDMHQRVSTLYCNRLPLIAQVNKLYSESANVAAVDLRSVQKREPHPSVLALGSEMRDKLRGSENNFVRHQILVLQVVECSL